MHQRWEVTYGKFADFMNNLEEVNAVLRDRGWPEFVAWAPTSGKPNEVVLISDYPDFATYKQQEAAAYADSEFMKAWRRGAEFVVQGSGFVELLEPAPRLA
jgi:hypothetical protein